MPKAFQDVNGIIKRAEDSGGQGLLPGEVLYLIAEIQALRQENIRINGTLEGIYTSKDIDFELE